MDKRLNNCATDKDDSPSEKESSRWVSLNVGGQTFVTSKQTLSRNRESFLFSLCEGRLQSDKDENGAFLIDRNPQYFAPVLDYLRHGKLIINKDVSEEGVLEEAEFYNLPGLVKLCKDRISSREGSKARASSLPAYLCYKCELAEMIASISDGWKLQQVFLLSPGVEYVCIVWKEFPDNDWQRRSFNGYDGLPGRSTVMAFVSRNALQLGRRRSQLVQQAFQLVPCAFKTGQQSPSSSEQVPVNTKKATVRASQKVPVRKPGHVHLIGAVRAMNDYCLKSEHLSELPRQVRRSPYIGEPPCVMYLESDVKALAIRVHGSLEALNKRQMAQRTLSGAKLISYRLGVDPSRVPHFQSAERKAPPEPRDSLLGSSRVVLTAVTVNAVNTSLKFFLWLHTGSHSLFAEGIHSLADTVNQVVLAFGIHQSVRQPDRMHPYGYSNARYVASLISGVGIFCFGTGLSVYHGVQGIVQPQELENLQWAVPLLGISLLTEGATFIMAWRELRKKAALEHVSFMRYVLNSEDPSLSVVFLEDLAAVVGLGIAAGCMALSVKLQSSMPDAFGSLMIGGLLGAVASLIIKANANHLVGRSIPEKEILDIVQGLEQDVMIRSIQDIKATEMGAEKVRFKAEIDFNGRNIARAYVETLELSKLLQAVQNISTEDELENFMLTHGEQVVDRLGAEIDRIEQELKKRFPNIRHVDLEVL
ncbi:hypothetical protein M513_05471 [Trichuris suis]|uniref:Proton-coupled zinc antiporter SLC30A9, mitochondrial n=2 Tax=Trichuris suis TaxID=68888 RepID=A0A085M8K9_9BILA|nr:hypothetical protein M513_05471 [Trichuris suis]